MALITDSWTKFAVAIALPVNSAAMFSAATFVRVVSVAVVSSSSSSAKMVYMLLFCMVYPICPAVLSSCCAKMQHWNAPPMKIFREWYAFGVIASQS
jgi:hypothetical protein